MSYYPSPYSPPQYSPTYAGFDHLLAPAKRAGLMLIILGAMIIAYAACNGASTASMTPDEMQKFQQMMGTTSNGVDIPLSAAKTMGLIFCGIALLAGFCLVTCGVFVRKGSSIANTFGLIINSLLLLGAGLLLIVTLILALAAPVMLILSCVTLVAVSLLGLAEFWLIQAIKVPGQIAAMQQQYQMQMWHYQQQAQAYAAAGYQQGYQQPSPPQTTPPTEPRQ